MIATIPVSHRRVFKPGVVGAHGERRVPPAGPFVEAFVGIDEGKKGSTSAFLTGRRRVG
jgi:hypothetical protein